MDTLEKSQTKETTANLSTSDKSFTEGVKLTEDSLEQHNSKIEKITQNTADTTETKTNDTYLIIEEYQNELIYNLRSQIRWWNVTFQLNEINTHFDDDDADIETLNSTIENAENTYAGLFDTNTKDWEFFEQYRTDECTWLKDLNRQTVLFKAIGENTDELEDEREQHSKECCLCNIINSKSKKSNNEEAKNESEKARKG